MSSQNEVNGTKLIKRYNPVLLITCILGLATIGVLLLYFGVGPYFSLPPQIEILF